MFDPTTFGPLQTLYALLGPVVLLPIAPGQKGPKRPGWQNTTLEKTQRASYQIELEEAAARGGNLGVLLGPASGRLLAYDVDDDQRVEQHLQRCPWLADTLRTRGARGCQFWLRLEEGCEYPSGQAVITTEDGELRLGGAGGAQSVIWGVHPAGMRYSVLVNKPPLTISLADLYELVPSLGQSATEAEPEPAPPELHRGDRLLDEPEQERPWPTIGREAFYGLFGQVVDLIAPATEADPVAILAQLLAAFGNVSGRSPYFYVEGVEHHTNLFQCIVGQSAKGRKGTSLNHILRLFDQVDSDWSTERQVTGLSSGEGVIWAVRDPIFEPERNRKTGEVAEVKIDNGIDDKRLFVVETEFAGALKVMGRPKNTLSNVLRTAWDTGTLRVLTKNSPARATNAHVSVVAHITEEELKRELQECEMFNGFCNRFLWLMAKRARCLPEGGKVPMDEFNQLASELRHKLGQACKIREMNRNGDARAYWHEVYPDLSTSGHGLAGTACNRAEAQTLRLSLIYALCDASPVISLEHLKAALAFWDYCKLSAYYLFGNRLENLNAQKILEALRKRPEGMTRKEILDEVFCRNIDKQNLAFALETLASLNLAKKQTNEATGGRPSERFFLKSIMTT